MLRRKFIKLLSFAFLFNIFIFDKRKKYNSKKNWIVNKKDLNEL